MNNVMVDLETMDTCPTAAIVSIGAAKFDLCGIIDQFYAVIDLDDCVKRGLTMSPSTVLWWMRQEGKTDTFDDSKAVTLESALRDFSDWLDPQTRVWGNGSDFDNVILRNAYSVCGIDAPWKYSNNACYRTIKNLAPHIVTEQIGITHNALDDAKTQAIHLIKLANHFVMHI